MILLVELAEPLNVAITPLAFLALGAAVLAPGPRGSSPPDRPPPNWLRSVCGAVALLALVPGVALVVGDVSLVQATGHYDIAQDGRALAKARWAERLLSPWPEPAVLYSQIRNYQAIGDNPDEIGSAIDWAKTASQRDPTSPSASVYTWRTTSSTTTGTPTPLSALKSPSTTPLGMRPH